MGYKALITIDLPDIDSSKRDEFYKVLSDKKWTKIDSLTTAWKVSFNDEFLRDKAIATLKAHLAKAKDTSEAESVGYAIQLEKEPVVIGEL
ncbi:MAG: hypothetical protein KAS71_00740 [Bacteroidales bacterium]|nr:hypothetical protein [Bacteroidales bacterium]